MSRYVFRYFFDPGSGICLWSDNDEAREKFDYPVELSDLGLSENLLRQAIHLIAWYDTSLDWSYPPTPHHGLRVRAFGSMTHLKTSFSCFAKSLVQNLKSVMNILYPRPNPALSGSFTIKNSPF